MITHFLPESSQLKFMILDSETKPKIAINRRRTNGEANKLALDDRPIHDWYRFVLSFPPHLVADYLEKFRIESGQTVLDPFCGTGTTLVECKKRGVNTVGIEANNMAYFASATKTNWQIDSDELRRQSRSISEQADNLLTTKGQSNLRTVGMDAEKLLLTNSISPIPLHKCLILRDLIDQHSGGLTRDYFRLALANVCVFVASNLQFGPEVGVGPPKSDAPVVEAWTQKVCGMAADIKAMRDVPASDSLVLHRDSRTAIAELPDRSVDAVFTSPPYPNEKDYTRTTRLESVLLGFVNNRQELQTMKRTLLRSNTRNVYKGDDDHLWIEQFPEIAELADEIERRRIELGKTSGFERMYARVTKLYFGGMARQLAEMRRILKPGAILGYVVGDQASYLRVMIRTGRLIGEIAVDLGYELVNIDLFRTRLATATKEQLREEVVVLRWNG